MCQKGDKVSISVILRYIRKLSNQQETRNKTAAIYRKKQDAE